MNPEVRSELAPSGVLRAGIDLANFLLVTGRGPEGEPRGVAPGMAAGIAERIGVDIACVPFATPSELADAGGGGRPGHRSHRREAGAPRPSRYRACLQVAPTGAWEPAP